MKFWSILKREVVSYFSSPFFYVLMTIFLLLSGYFFYTDTVRFNWMNFMGTAGLNKLEELRTQAERFIATEIPADSIVSISESRDAYASSVTIWYLAEKR